MNEKGDEITIIKVIRGEVQQKFDANGRCIGQKFVPDIVQGTEEHTFENEDGTPFVFEDDVEAEQAAKFSHEPQMVPPNQFADACWVAEDVLSIRPELSIEDAEAILDANEEEIREKMIAAGWDVLHNAE